MPPRKKALRRGKSEKSVSKKLLQKAKGAAKSTGAPRKEEKRAPVRGTRTSPDRLSAFQASRQALLESEEKHRVLFNQARDGIVLVDAETGRIIDCNSEFEKQTGRKLKQLKNMKIWEVRPPEKVAAAKRKFFEIREKRTGGSSELEFQQPKGKIVPVDFISSVITLRDKKYIHSIVRDITESKQAEEKLAEANKLFEALLDHTHMMVACLDSEFNFVKVNRAYAEADERVPSFFPGKNHFSLYPNAENEEIFRRVVETAESYFASAKPFEYAEHPERGASYWDWSLIPIKDSAGGVTGLVLTLVNVTERKQAEEALKRAHDELEIRVKERTAELTEAIRELQAEVNQRKRAEAKAKASHEEYRTLVETSNDMIFTVDLKGNFQFTNQAFGKVLGYSAEEIKKINGFELIHPEDSEIVREQFARLVEGNSVGNMEYRYRTKEGSYISILNNASPIFDPNGNVVAALGAARDITERKRTEKALQESELWMRNMFNSLEEAVLVVTPDRTLVNINQAAEKMFGYTKSELADLSTEVLHVDHDHYVEFGRRIKEAFDKGKTASFEFEAKRKNGEIFPTEHTVSLLKNDMGESLGIVSVVRDISERKRAEEALKASENKYRILLENVPQKIFLKSRNSVYVSCNQNFAGDLNIKAEEIAGKTDYDFFPKELAEKYRADDKRIMKLGKTEDIEERYVQDGQQVFVHTVKTPVKDERGKLIGLLGIFWDVTERKRAEQELKQYREHLEELVDERTAELKSANQRLKQEIAERKQVEEGLEWQLAVNTELARLSGALITPSSCIEDVANIVLDSAGRLTQSEHGFVSSIDPKTLDTVAHTLTKMMGKQCLVRGKNRRIRFPIGADGRYSSLWGHALNTREAFLTNAPGLHEAARGIPAGHIPIKNFLSVPAVIGEELVGQIALANSPRDYADRDLEAIKRLAQLYAMAIHRKRGEEALRESEEKFRNLADQSPNMIFINKGGRVVYANKKCEEIMGYKREEFYSPDFDFFALISPQSKDLIKSNFSKHTSGEEVLPCEYALVTKEGREIDAILTTKLIRYEGENGILGTVTDITERKRTEEELQKRTHDLDERVKELNCLFGVASLVQKPGISLEEILEGTLQLIPPAWRYPEITCARVVLEGHVFKTKNFRETSWRQASDIIVGDHPVGTLEVYYLEEKPERDEGPFLAEERSLINAIAERLARITERKKGEHQIQELNRSLKLRAAELAAANRELEAFSYSVSHDLRAPLRAVEGFSRALAEDYSDSLDKEGKDYLKRIRAASQHMKQLIEDLLNLSLTVRKEMSREETNLSDLARTITAELQKTEPKRQVQFAIQERVLAHGDRRLLRDVLENLLGNAWKFTEKHSQAKIEFGVTKEEGQNVYFVRDDGAGFDKTHADRLFVPFQRLHSTAEFSGNGIGLAVVSRIITRHGGRIWAEGEVEKGATFYFTL